MATASPLPTTAPSIPAPYSQPGARYGVRPLPAGQQPQIALRMAPEWRDRALALADKAALKGTPHHHCWREQREEWLVPTRNRHGADHRVWLDCRRGALTCDCISGGYGGACCHVGAVLDWMMSYDEAYRPRTPREEVDDNHWYDLCAWAAEQPLYR